MQLHRVAFHATPPSFAHGMHFLSAAQSCSMRLHSKTSGFAIGSSEQEPPPLPVSVVVSVAPVAPESMVADETAPDP